MEQLYKVGSVHAEEQNYRTIIGATVAVTDTPGIEREVPLEQMPHVHVMVVGNPPRKNILARGPWVVSPEDLEPVTTTNKGLSSLLSQKKE